MKTQAEKKRELIDALVKRLREDVGPEQADIAARLAHLCYEGVPLGDLRLAGDEGLIGPIRSVLGLIQTHTPSDISIRVFNPQDDDAEWGGERTVFEVLSDDMPFLVDSVTAELDRRDLTIHLALHPQLSVRRDDDGKILELLPHGSDGEGISRESLMHFHVDQQGSQGHRVDLETALLRVLGDVQSAVTEWKTMRQACLDAVTRLRGHVPDSIDAGHLQETVEFLEWVAHDHFTFLGYIEYDLHEEDGEEYLRPEDDTGLGLLRQLPLRLRAEGRMPVAAEARRFLHGDELVMISKTSQHSTVHRNVHMDVISLKRFGAEGEVDGEIQFVGLFTSMAYSIAASNIPLVRRKVESVLDRTGFLPASHDAKVMRHIVEHYPRDELFQISAEDLYHFSLRILELQLRPRLALLVRRDEEERFVSCMVYVPRERHNTEVRLQIQRTLEDSFAGTVTAYYTRISDRPLAQLQFIVKTRPGAIPEYDVEQIEATLAEATKSWPDRLKEALGATGGEEGARIAWRRYGSAFSGSYQQYFTEADALKDIPLVDRVLEDGELGLRLYRREQAAERRFHLRTFELATQRPLSSFLPILENMGLTVINEYPFEVRPLGSANPVWVRDFEVEAHVDVDLEEAHDRFEDALQHVYRGEVEDDPFNKLVLSSRLEWRQVVILRAYFKYLRQIGVAFSRNYMSQTLVGNDQITHSLIDLFFERFDPNHQEGVDRSQLILAEIHHGLEQVQSLDEDRILRRFLNLVQSTLRTNFFQKTEDGRLKDYVSFKFDAVRVLDLPNPRPVYEVFVYSPRVEAVHLRGGQVARGGIRWSDRLEDFRTEILGLVKSQMVKNAVIVPVGAKGGFIVKNPPPASDREAWLAEGVECYKTLIRGLLDLTDNLKGSSVVPPQDVVRHDGDDPYLVVAADKGTATFSDIANGVAADYDFWLGDAFASGGSVGYDHKKMGITARGAWEGVKRHFREIGRDIQTQAFTCVGVGDMSGDVFGNGMLLSTETRLVAAFNHLHVFVDPEPSTEEAWDERKRLFDLPRSSWADYDETKLSEGGGIFERSAKQITVSRQIVDRFHLESETLTPAELIRAILRARVDLLWFGGIGTYVKASEESHVEVGDRANDEIRVNAEDLGCLVIGEGANLGVTQRGRVEFAMNAGRVNTDFIDNSGGVDCSDHEVNIKIVLRDAVASGVLEGPARDELLVDMTDEVSHLVLRDNYLQTQSISLAESQGMSLLDEQARLMRNLERLDRLDRRLEFLPDDSTLDDRKQRKVGLTRPEIAILLAYSKISLFNDLLDSDMPEDGALVEDLVRYFPEPMQGKLRWHIERHRLRREIIATHVTNSIVNRVGPTFVTRIAEETGRKGSDIARAYTAARDIFELRSMWDEIEALDNQIDSAHQTRMFLMTVNLVGTVIRWFLRHGGRPFDVGACMKKYESDIVVVAAQLEDLLPPAARRRVQKRRRRWVDLGVPRALAERIASLDIMPSACDVARAAQVSQGEVDRVGKVYFTVGERFGIDSLRRAAEHMATDSAYAQAAITATLDDLSLHQAEITRQVVQYQGGAKKAIGSWIESRKDAVERLEALRADFEAAAHIDLAMLAIAERELRRLVELE